jgi:hypothetical protein
MKDIEQVIVGKYVLILSTNEVLVNEIVHGCTVYRGKATNKTGTAIFCGECSDKNIIDIAMDLLLMEQI